MRLDMGVSHEALKTLSALGDPVFMVLCAGVVFLQMWQWSREAAYGWALVVALAVALTVLVKTAFYVLALDGEGAWRMHSPSGHMAIATVAYGGCASLFAAGRPPAVKAAIWTAVAGMLSGLGLSRLMLGLHSELEVFVGLLIGAVCLAGYRLILSSRGVPKVAGVPLLALLVLLHLARFTYIDGEVLVGRVAHRIQQFLGA